MGKKPQGGLLGRRNFLKGSLALAGTGATLSSTTTAAKVIAGSPHLDKKLVPSASHWGPHYLRVEGGKVVGIEPHPLDQYPEAMSLALPDNTYSPTRVKYPMVRKSYLEKGYKATGEGRGKDEFVRVTWDKAIELIANELERVKAEHGNSAIFGGSYGWKTPGLLHNCFNNQYRMLNAFGGFVDDANTYSTGAIRVIMPHVVGASFYASSSWEDTLKHSEQIVFWGSDPATTSKIGWSVPDHATMVYLNRWKNSGRKTTVIDPIYNRTAEFLDSEWIAPNPGTDVALGLALCHTLLVEELYDADFLDEYTEGFEEFKKYLLGETEDKIERTAEWGEEITSIPADRIRELARSMAAKRTLISMGWSIQRQHHGEQGPWIAMVLACMVGQVGLPGGGADFTYHYASSGTPKATAPKFIGFSAGKAPSGLPKPIPVSRVPWCMGNPGATYHYNGEERKAPDLRMIMWTGGNPLHHHQDRNKHIEYWRKPETIVVSEIQWTATAKFADIVLPACTAMERNDMCPVGRGGAGFIAMKQAIEPMFESKSDFEIYGLIAAKLGLENKYNEGLDEMGWLKKIYASGEESAKKKNISLPAFDDFWNGDGYLKFETSKKAEEYRFLGDFREDPLINSLPTPSGLIEIYSRRIASFNYDDCKGHPTWMEPLERLGGNKSDKYKFHVNSKHPDDRLHSQLDNTWLRNRYEVQQREPVWIHPEDAKPLGIEDGDIVKVFNERGTILCGAVLTDKVRRNVLKISEGGWYDPLVPGEVGTLDVHGDINVLSPDIGTSKLAQGNCGHTVMANIELYKGKLPAIKAFTAPKNA